MHKAEKRRKRVVLTLEDKLGVVQDREIGENQIDDCYCLDVDTIFYIFRALS